MTRRTPWSPSSTRATRPSSRPPPSTGRIFTLASSHPSHCPYPNPNPNPNSNSNPNPNSNQGEPKGNDESVKQLMEMGFEQEQCNAALASCNGDVNEAMEKLLSQ